MRVAAAFALALLLACGGAPLTRTQYLLREAPTAQAGAVSAGLRVGLGRVTVAPYLDQPGIVVETETGQVRAASGHVWAEPLEDGLRSSLRAGISEALGLELGTQPSARRPWDYVVDVHVDRLHGTMGGEVWLEADYRITPRSELGEPVDYRFVRSARLPRDGYPGLVEAEAALSRELARAIAASLRGSLP